jgi:hypothetical protein
MVTWAEKILDGEGSLILPRHLLEEVRKNSSSKVFILNKDSSIQLDMFRVEEKSEEKAPQLKSIVEDAHEHFTHGQDKVAMETKTVITYNDAHPDGSPKAPEDESWDGPRAFTEADGVGNLYDMCTYYDEDGETKGDYKLPHHHPDGTVVLRGVQAAMASLMGSRGGVDIPAADRRGVYNHLAEHYRAFDKEPPEFKSAGVHSADAEEMASSIGRDGEVVPDELLEKPKASIIEDGKEKELTLDASQAKEADSQDEVETNDDDLRRLAKATFEQRVLSLTQELKSLVGEISRGVDR